MYNRSHIFRSPFIGTYSRKVLAVEGEILNWLHDPSVFFQDERVNRGVMIVIRSLAVKQSEDSLVNRIGLIDCFVSLSPH